MASAALTARGTGRAATPRRTLVRIEERFTFDGAPVPAPELEEVVEHLRVLAGRLLGRGRLQATPHVFEVATAAAFELFRPPHVEAAVLEVGWADASTPRRSRRRWRAPSRTSRLDHQQYLGGTLAEIAFEKAGIAKPGCALSAGSAPPGRAALIAEACARQGAAFVDASDGVSVSATMAGGLTSLTLGTPAGSYGPLTLGSRGRHQVQNALVAVRLLEALSEAGVPVPAPAIERGCARRNGQAASTGAAWPAGSACSSTRRTMRRGRPRWLSICERRCPAGASRSSSAPCATRITPACSAICCRARARRRHGPADAARSRSRRAERRGAGHRCGALVIVERDPVAAMDAAWASAPEITVAGSIFLLGAVLPVLESRRGAW